MRVVWALLVWLVITSAAALLMGWLPWTWSLLLSVEDVEQEGDDEDGSEDRSGDEGDRRVHQQHGRLLALLFPLPGVLAGELSADGAAQQESQDEAAEEGPCDEGEGESVHVRALG